MRSLIAVLLVAAPVFANTTLFTKYENTRQGFLKKSLAHVKKGAGELAAEARKAKNETVATRADAVVKAPDMTKARAAFGALSQEMIKVREATKGARPAVYSCPMVKKSWLQPKGDIGNPYDAAMVTCGVLEKK